MQRSTVGHARTRAATAVPAAAAGRTTMNCLIGAKIAILVADGFEELQLTEPLIALDREGAVSELVAPHGREVRAWADSDWGGRYRVDLGLDAADPELYHGLLLPGGMISADRLRSDEAALRFVRGFLLAGKPIAAHGHGVQVLIDAEAVDGRKVTSSPTLRRDLIHAGAEWLDEPVVVDGGLVTGRAPEDLAAFVHRLVEAFAAALARPSTGSRHCSDEPAL
jgi:protease I